MRRYSLAMTVALTAILPPPVAANATAQETPSDSLLTVDHYMDWEGVSDPRISPDGSQIIFTRQWVDPVADRMKSSLWIMNADGSRQRFLIEGSAARWSPDGSRIAYLAEGEPAGPQIWVRWMDAEGASTQVTREVKSPSAPVWSPDGNRLAFTMLVPESEPWNIDMPAPPEGAQWTEAPRRVERVHFRQDFQGFREEGTSKLFVVPATGGTPRRLTLGAGYVGSIFSGLTFGSGSMEWTPDGRTIVFEGILEEDWERRYNEAYIYAIDVETRETRRIFDRKGLWSAPALSPDGRRVAFIGYEWTPQTYRVSDLHVVNIDGSGMRNLSDELDRDAGSLTWAPDGGGVYFTAEDRGSQNVHFAALDGTLREVTRGTHMLTLGTISRDGRTAVGVRSAPQEPGDIVRYVLRGSGDPQRLTAVNEDVLHGIALGDVEEIWFNARDGTRAQGWIVKPPHFDDSRDYPLVLSIHGGPHAMYNVGFSYSFQNFAANDYVVLYTNPRGSTGYGTEFGNAIDDGYPSVDYDDLMAGVDAVIEHGYIDTDNMFVTGCSGGGVLTSWVIGHTDRFAAAGVRCPVVNWISFAGTTDIVDWGFYRFRGYFWENPDNWLEHSPLMYVGNVKTPTVIMTGELDLRTPMSQSEEYYQALKQVGVPAVLLRFNNEYHGTGSMPSNFMRTQLYLMSWFEKWGSIEGRVTTESAMR